MMVVPMAAFVEESARKPVDAAANQTQTPHTQYTGGSNFHAVHLVVMIAGRTAGLTNGGGSRFGVCVLNCETSLRRGLCRRRPGHPAPA